jgi:hypothetical protein
MSAVSVYNDDFVGVQAGGKTELNLTCGSPPGSSRCPVKLQLGYSACVEEAWKQVVQETVTLDEGVESGPMEVMRNGVQSLGSDGDQCYIVA